MRFRQLRGLDVDPAAAWPGRFWGPLGGGAMQGFGRLGCEGGGDVRQGHPVNPTEGWHFIVHTSHLRECCTSSLLLTTPLLLARPVFPLCRALWTLPSATSKAHCRPSSSSAFNLGAGRRSRFRALPSAPQSSDATTPTGAESLWAVPCPPS